MNFVHIVYLILRNFESIFFLPAQRLSSLPPINTLRFVNSHVLPLNKIYVFVGLPFPPLLPFAFAFFFVFSLFCFHFFFCITFFRFRYFTFHFLLSVASDLDWHHSIAYSFLRSPLVDVCELPFVDSSFLANTDCLPLEGNRVPVLVILIQPKVGHVS